MELAKAREGLVHVVRAPEVTKVTPIRRAVRLGQTVIRIKESIPGAELEELKGQPGRGLAHGGSKVLELSLGGRPPGKPEATRFDFGNGGQLDWVRNPGTPR